MAVSRLRRRRWCSAGVAAIAATLLFPSLSLARKSAPPPPPAAVPSALKDLGREFESARLLNGIPRFSALQRLDQGVDGVLNRDLDDEQKAAARLLSGEIQFELGNYKEASEALDRAEDAGKGGPFADLK